MGTADETPPASLQALDEFPTDAPRGGLTLVEGLTSRGNTAPAEASAVDTEELLLEEPEGSVMRNIFTEIQLLSGKVPSSPLTKVSLLLRVFKNSQTATLVRICRDTSGI